MNTGIPKAGDQRYGAPKHLLWMPEKLSNILVILWNRVYFAYVAQHSLMQPPDMLRSAAQ